MTRIKNLLVIINKSEDYEMGKLKNGQERSQVVLVFVWENTIKWVCEGSEITANALQ